MSANNKKSYFTDEETEAPRGISSPVYLGFKQSGPWKDQGAGDGRQLSGTHLSGQVGVPRTIYSSEEVGGLGSAALEAVLSLGIAGRPWQRQFPPTADSVLFNLELKCKQGPEPTAPTPNRILCSDGSAGGGLPSGERWGRLARGPGPTRGWRVGFGGGQAICLGQPAQLAGIFHPN